MDEGEQLVGVPGRRSRNGGIGAQARRSASSGPLAGRGIEVRRGTEARPHYFSGRTDEARLTSHRRRASGGEAQRQAAGGE